MPVGALSATEAASAWRWWQSSTVKAILDNPRYTGFPIYGRWQRVEELLDPEDVAAGHLVRFRKSPTSKIVRSVSPRTPRSFP
ncbi:recombinase family protein [Kribbella sp. NBC_01510]|uniref:recombinase family protein n=1 Tax=Kribbella sp. NBC_01510 TaxID=2903581 RepID=UPI0038680285